MNNRLKSKKSSIIILLFLVVTLAVAISYKLINNTSFAREPKPNASASFEMTYEVISNDFSEKGMLKHDGDGNWSYEPKSEKIQETDYPFVVVDDMYYQYDKQDNTWLRYPNDGSMGVGFDPELFIFTESSLNKFIDSAEYNPDVKCRDKKCQGYSKTESGITRFVLFEKSTGRLVQAIESAKGVPDTIYNYNYKNVSINKPQNTVKGELYYDGNNGWSYTPLPESNIEDDYKFIVKDGTYYMYVKETASWYRFPNDGSAGFGFDPVDFLYDQKSVDQFIAHSNSKRKISCGNSTCIAYINKSDDLVTSIYFNEKNGYLEQITRQAGGVRNGYKFVYDDVHIQAPEKSKNGSKLKDI